jgi:hypothetical protein
MQAIPERLHNSSLLVLDPSVADFFYVPVMFYCHNDKTKDFAAEGKPLSMGCSHSAAVAWIPAIQAFVHAAQCIVIDGQSRCVPVDMQQTAPMSVVHNR